MQTIQKQLLLSLLISSSTTLLNANCASPSDEMWEEIEHFHQLIEKRMARMRQEMKTSMNPFKEIPNISMKNIDTGVQISIPNILLKDRNFDAQFDQDNNLLVVSIPTGSISIQAGISNKKTYLTTMLKLQDSKDLDKNQTAGTIYSHSQVSQTINGEIEMGQAEIEYDSQSQELMITIPQRKRKMTKIPVHFKDPQENK